MIAPPGASEMPPRIEYPRDPRRIRAHWSTRASPKSHRQFLARPIHGKRWKAAGLGSRPTASSPDHPPIHVPDHPPIHVPDHPQIVIKACLSRNRQFLSRMAESADLASRLDGLTHSPTPAATPGYPVPPSTSPHTRLDAGFPTEPVRPPAEPCLISRIDRFDAGFPTKATRPPAEPYNIQVKPEKITPRDWQEAPCRQGLGDLESQRNGSNIALASSSLSGQRSFRAIQG